MTINDIWLVAVSSEDYVAVSNFTLMFDRCQRKSCVNLTVVNDAVLEMVESFIVSLGNSNPNNSIQTEDRFAHLTSRISIDPATAVIHIIDIDGGVYTYKCKLLISSYLYIFAEVTTGQEKTNITVPEGVGNIKVCVNLNCPGTRPNCSVAFIHLSTLDDTAGSYTHYQVTPLYHLGLHCKNMMVILTQMLSSQLHSFHM